MKTTKFRSYWIVSRSVFISIRISLIIIFKVIFGLLSRQEADRLIKKWADCLLDFVGLSCSVFNADQIKFDPDRCYIIMSNHSSLYDIPLIFKLFRDKSIRMIAKKELFRVPVWGNAMKVAEYIPIDRENSNQAREDLKFAKQKMESGIIPLIFPEGTRSRTGKLQAFKKGGFLLARQAKAIIIPVAIRGSGKILPPKTLDFHVGEHVEIHVGKPIDTMNYTAAQKDKLTQDVREEIIKALE